MKFFDKSIKYISSLIFMYILGLLLLFSNNIKFPYRKIFLISNLVFLIIFIIIILIRKNIKFRIKNIDYDKLVKKLFIIFFILQLYIFYHTFFETGWDPWALIRQSRKIAANGSKNVIPEGYLLYFSKYPNNLLYTMIASLILKINSYIGLFSNSYDLMSIVFVNSLISSISSLLVYKVGSQLFSKKIGFFGFILSTILCTFSPWNIICYSDAFCLFVPILILYIYINKKLKWFIKYPLISIIGLAFISCKPHTFMIVIAIYIVEILRNISKITLNKIKKVFVIGITSILFFVSFNFCMNKIYRRYGFIINKETKLGISHFLMMGANKQTNGAYYNPDVLYSQNIKTRKERTKANLDKYEKRVSRMGTVGYAKFLSKKVLIAYHDGSFAWAEEGTFFKRTKPKTTKISGVLRNIYYGKYTKYYETLLQFVWINILLFIFINPIIELIKKNKVDYIYLVLLLSFIGLFVFELLFEVRARYLYTSVPIYIILMMYGLNNISKLKFKKKNIQE